MEGAKRHCRGYGLEEAINFPQLKLMELDWYLGSMDSDPKLYPLHALVTAHTPRYPDTLVLVWAPHVYSFQVKLPRYYANICSVPPL